MANSLTEELALAEELAENLRRVREDTVRRHIQAENDGDVEAVLATFRRPRYHVVPSGEVTQGEDAVRDLMSGLLQSFPDFHFEEHVLHHADEAVILEGTMTGTQRGPWAGLEPQGQRMNVRMACVFEFDGEHLMNETVYFDFATAQRQLTANS